MLTFFLPSLLSINLNNISISKKDRLYPPFPITIKIRPGESGHLDRIEKTFQNIDLDERLYVIITGSMKK